ncbi:MULTISPECIES: hypothetical protein [Streptomyces]|uniref:Uncharacterized protein n=1 Tax=Streptomyces hundungensis TaxID=1077946 RepID=A0A387HDV1_9ACTN|nr:hypothetical protein [Streptomyces hundungensis]AYG79120.1 hypothetical protein DWB77_01230 [Streptomyces hundungensis]
MVFFLLLVIAAIVLGFIGVLAHGLLYLLFIAIVLFAGALVHLAVRWRHSGRGRVR